MTESVLPIKPKTFSISLFLELSQPQVYVPTVAIGYGLPGKEQDLGQWFRSRDEPCWMRAWGYAASIPSIGDSTSFLKGNVGGAHMMVSIIED